MVVESGKIRELASAVGQMNDRLNLAKEDAKAAMDAVGAAGLNKQAFKLAMRLKDMDQAKARVFLDSFDACRDALDLDAQLDIEDAIEAAEKLDAMAARDGGATVTDSGGNVLAEFGKGDGIRKARGRARELN